ncbi:MAG: response regulator, partial [Bacteroidales bacterium]|nr:response regulator [Bacteroidales bacterium]
ISHIKTNSEVLLNLVDDIIDLSLIEAGDLHISKTWHNLNDILRSVYVYHKKKKGIYSSGEVKFHMRINERLNTLNIYTDSIRFRQIFNYLIKNAFKFTYQGYIEFGYQIKKDNLVFYVKDSGIGIPKERHNEIFKVFRKFDVEESKIYQGTGLGLSIAKKLVNLLDGEIWVESEPGKGSVFYFSVPVENINVGETKTVKREVEKDWNDKTILVVDDLDYNYELIVTALKRTKANLLRASDGNEAVEICKKNNNIDLILMDIRMPVMDGYEATREIKKINDHIPIIAQTAYAMFEEREKSLMVGCNDYITKPISKKFLLEVIDKYL